MLLQRRGQPAGERQEQEQHRDRDDPDVERQLLGVPQPEAGGEADVVAALADDAVRA